ncbi:hypothetical protein TNCV_2300921 [Trichonephila clavipes]|nr:hypothetical protein TNCV_2300921 [Trichonephila clavipes]
MSLKDNPQSQYATNFPRSNSETWSKDARCVPRGIGKQDYIDYVILQFDGATPHWSAYVRDYLDELLPLPDGSDELQTATCHVSNGCSEILT